MPILLDLCCGAGGASKGYTNAGFTVVGVDYKKQLNYPYMFREDTWYNVLDKLLGGCSITFSSHKTLLGNKTPAEYLTIDLSDIAAIHASPPCQLWSPQTRPFENSYTDQITPLRAMLQATEKPYVIENVVGSPLVDPITLCGSSFGLGLRRHRLFESNVKLFDLPCRHGWQLPRFKNHDHGRWNYAKAVKVYGNGTNKANGYWSREMEIDWMTRAEITQAIPPAYTRYVGGQLLAFVECRADADNPFNKLVATTTATTTA